MRPFLILYHCLRNFVVYKSGAGSGKTFTLVKEYLKLSLYDEKKLQYNYKRILAVTFTNKAAAEMKTRVIKTLSEITTAHQLPTLGAILCTELNISSPELQKRASIVFSDMLHHYSDLSIGTIDSFTHKIVKTFAHDLKLPVNFNVELDTETFYNRVIATIFSKIGEDDYISQLLREYALNMASDNASWDPEKQIQDFTRLLLKENAGSYVDRLKAMSVREMEEVRAQIRDFIKHYRHTLTIVSKKAIDAIAKAGLTDNDFTYKKSGPQNFFRKCLQLSVSLTDTNGARIQEAVNSNKWAAKDGNLKLVEEIAPELNQLARELIDFIASHYTYYSLCETLDKQMYPLMLLKKIEEISSEQKLEERLVFISEFNHKIFDVINNEPTPFIYERLGERYRHYLLDEFQDTSTLQWHNILPLIDNSLAMGWYNLLVGDGKQSIYRWRNANVQQFSKLPEVEQERYNPLMAERADALSRNYEARLLNTNFRSAKRVVEFNNDFFKFASETLLDENSRTIYEGHAQISNAKEGEGYVSVVLGKAEPELLDQQVCNQIRKHISQALDQGFEYKDIAILSRKNDQGNLIADYLVSQKIPVVSSDSLLLKNNLEVNVVLSYLRYLINRNDHISAGAVIQYLNHAGCIADTELHEVLASLAKGKSLFQILADYNIQLNEEMLSLNNLFDHCLQIITFLNLTEAAFPYLRFFLDEVNEFLVTKNSNLSSFFDWWESKSKNASMIIPENTNAVRIMTIHASKGLEFPVVIIPYCNWAYYRADNRWVDVPDPSVKLPVSVVSLSKKAAESGFEKELQKEEQEQKLDNLNLLYVAFTRAVERLHIICTASDGQKKQSVAEWVESYAENHLPKTSETDYELGTLIRNQSNHSNGTLPAFFLEPLRFNGPNQNIHIKASYKLENQDAEQARQQGLLIHFLLAQLESNIALDQTLSRAVLTGLITEDQKIPLTAILNEIVFHPELRNYFEPDIVSKREAELITANGELLRPDRLVFETEGAVIIDYKTGKENSRKYEAQLLSYENALRSMGWQNIKKILVYIDPVKVIRLN